MNYTKQGIPKIIHQIWINESNLEFPNHWKTSPQEWKKLHPDWEYILWEKDNSRKFVETYFPQYLEVYDSFKYVIQRCDMIRYCFLYHYGGVYCDMDNYPTENIEKYLNKNADLYFPEYQVFYGYNTINNNLIFAKKHNQLFMDILNYLKNRPNKFYISKAFEIHDTNCIHIINNAIKQKKYNIYVLPREKFSPYSLIDNINHDKGDVVIKTVEGKSWHGTDMKIITFLIKNFMIILIFSIVIIICVSLVITGLKNMDLTEFTSVKV